MSLITDHIQAANIAIPNLRRGSLFLMILKNRSGSRGLLYPEVKTLDAEKCHFA